MKCPKCGEELPLLTKVCPFCRTVVDTEDGAPDAQALTQEIDQVVLTLQKCAQEASSVRIGAFAPLFLLVLAVFLALIGLRSGGALWWLLAVGALAWAVVAFRKQQKTGLGFRISEAGIAYDHGKTLVRRYFSGRSEMTAYLRNADERIGLAEADIRAGKRKNLIAGILIAVVEAVLLLLLVRVIPSKDVKENVPALPEGYEARIEYYLSEGAPQSAVQVFADSEYNNDFVGGEQRRKLCQALCAAGYYAEAEAFCAQYCMGKVDDLDCAKAIVQAYILDGRQAEAKAFVDKCVNFRYASDAEKLRALVQNN